MNEKYKPGRICALILTHGCNLNCVYCFQQHKSNHPSKQMSLETAQSIFLKEFEFAKNSNNIQQIKFELFGGEPMLRFDLIKKLCEWVWNLDVDVDYFIHITTNGTLLNEDNKNWLRANKERIRLILSIDGRNDVQKSNRGSNAINLPIAFALETWPDLYLKMTMSRKSLHRFADETIYFYENGYNVEGSLAVGEAWQEGDEIIYEEQLKLIAAYYLKHPNAKPFGFFMKPFHQLFNDKPDILFGKSCGAGVTIATYDIDGRVYPCHLFVPNVHGNSDVLNHLEKIDFSNPEHFMTNEEDCLKCKLLRVCKTCAGFNFNQRGAVSRRDKHICKMILAEVKIISVFQIKYLMQKKERLSLEELVILKSALNCYKHFKDINYSNIINKTDKTVRIN